MVLVHAFGFPTIMPETRARLCNLPAPLNSSLPVSQTILRQRLSMDAKTLAMA